MPADAAAAVEDNAPAPDDSPALVDTGLADDNKPAAPVADDDKPEGSSSLLDLAGDAEDDAAADDKPEEKGDVGSDDKEPLLKVDARPDWLAKNFYDEATGVVDVEGLAKSQRDLRAKISEKGEVPADVDGYVFEAGEALQDIESAVLLDVEGGDPLVKGFKAICLEEQIPAPVANRIYQAYLEAIGGVLPEPIDQEAEIKALGTRGRDVVSLVENKVKTMFKNGTLSPEERDKVASWMTSAADISAMHKILQSMGEIGIPTTAPVTDGARSAADLQSEMGLVMKEMDEGKPGANARYQKLLQDYEKTYGTAEAGSSVVVG